MIPLHDDNPTLHPPVLTVVFIALNALVFFWQLAGDTDLKVRRYAAIPYNITQSDEEVVTLAVENERGEIVEVRDLRVPRGTEEAVEGPLRVIRPALPAWATLLSSMFMHGGWMHLIGNMFFLWIFGNNIEDALGKVRFVVFYLGTGLAASLAHILSDPESVIPTLGASGAVSGILGGYILLYPKARVLALIPLGVVMMTQKLPAFVFLGLWFGMQILNLFGASAGVAWYAHIGGFVVGLALVKLFESREHRERQGIRFVDRSPRWR